METNESKKQKFDYVLNNLEKQIESYNFNDGRRDLHAINDFAKWSDDGGLGVDIRFFDKRARENIKYFLRGEYLSKPLCDKELTDLDDINEYKDYIDTDIFYNMTNLFCMATEGLMLAKELIDDYHSKLSKIKNFVDGIDEIGEL